MGTKFHVSTCNIALTITFKIEQLRTPLFCPIAAGHYVPATAQVILESNSIYSKNLKGIGIGNGWVDPYVQYAAYAKVSVCGGMQPYACACV